MLARERCVGCVVFPSKKKPVRYPRTLDTFFLFSMSSCVSFGTKETKLIAVVLEMAIHVLPSCDTA